MAIIDVIKYNGDADVLAFKYPDEELGTWTQLIVGESQEAVLFKEGQALDVLTSGRHTLDTANIPLLNHIINLPFGGRSPFTAEVWYVDKRHTLDIKWGTATPIQLQDPKYGLFVPVRSFGSFGIQIKDSKKFLIKLVGTSQLFTQTELAKYFRGLYVTKIKDSISNYLVHKQIGILEINAYLDEISEYMKEKMRPVLDEYGISLINFYVNDISVPDDDPAVLKLKDALAKRAEMDIIGFDYGQERTFDTLEGAAANRGSGSGSGSGLMGMGMDMAMGSTLGHMMGQQFDDLTDIFNSMSATKTKSNTSIEFRNCPKCNTLVEKGKSFCSECGLDMASKAKSEKIKCSNCGALYDPTVKFCPECADKYRPCPNCKSDMPGDSQVCTSCGYQPPKVCTGCGTTITVTQAKFCPECGKSLQ